MNSATEGLGAFPELVTYADEDEIDLREYAAIVNRNKWGIIGFATVVCIFTVVVVAGMTPIFEATARLLIESKEANVVSIEEVYGIDSSKREYYLTQFEILNSQKLAVRVIRKLNIQQHPEYEPGKTKQKSLRSYMPFLPLPEQLPEAQKWQGIVNRFRNNLSITPVRNTQLVDIRFRSSDPELAPKVANAIGNAYIDSQLEARLELTQKASSWLTDRLSGMRSDLEQAEKNLRAYQERENLVDVSGVQTLTAKELDELTRRLVVARNAAAVAKSQFDAVGNVGEGYSERWEALPGVLRDHLAQELKSGEASAESAFLEFKRRYGPKHPKYISAASQLNTAKSVFRDRVERIVIGFNEEFQQAAADQRDIESALEKSKDEIQEINRKQYDLSQLEREVSANRQLYDMFFQRFKETNETDFAAANARFIDEAERPFVPVKPKKLLLILLAGGLSVVAGILLAFLRTALDNTIRTPQDLEAIMGQSVFGVIPFEKKIAKGMSTTVLYQEKGYNSFSEAIRSLRTSVVLSGLDKPHKVLVITSSVPGEGKTTIAANLAMALGKLEKVLLIDADMRRPSLASEMDYEKGVQGLAELVAGTNDLSECVQETQYGMDLITAGAIPSNPLDLLSSSRFEKMLTVLRDKYDRIIIDSAPTQAVSDSLVLSTKADALIYVVKSDSTLVDVALNGLRRLAGVQAPVIGVVLNQFDAENAAKYGNYGYGYVSKSYV